MIDVLTNPLFYSSPSPWSLTVYAILAFLGSRLLLRSGAQYRRWPQVFAFLDALFIVVIVVLIQDSLWLVVNTLRWLPEYGVKMNFNYWMRYVQNFSVLALSFYLVKDKFRTYFDFELRSFGFVLSLYLVVLVTHFIIAPDPSFTDWTYAVRFRDSEFRIVWGFIMGHIVGKIWIALLVFSVYSPIRWVNQILQSARAKKNSGPVEPDPQTSH